MVQPAPSLPATIFLVSGGHFSVAHFVRDLYRFSALEHSLLEGGRWPFTCSTVRRLLAVLWCRTYVWVGRHLEPGVHLHMELSPQLVDSAQNCSSEVWVGGPTGILRLRQLVGCFTSFPRGHSVPGHAWDPSIASEVGAPPPDPPCGRC